MDGDIDLVATLEGELERLLHWIQAADARLRLVLPLSTAMLGTLGVLAPTPDGWTVPGGIFSTLAALMLTLSIAFAALASFPRTKGPKGSLIYFEGIDSFELDQYAEAVLKITRQSYHSDLTKQCHRNAQIAKRKFKWVQASMAALFCAFVPWILAVFVLYGKP